MRTDWQTIAGNVPSKSNCYKVISIAGHSSLGKTKALREYERNFFIQCGVRGLNISDYFVFHCRVFYPSQRSDLDNSLKVLLDCLQATKTIRNDNLCVGIHAEKYVDKERPRVEFCIETAGGVD